MLRTSAPYGERFRISAFPGKPSRLGWLKLIARLARLRAKNEIDLAVIDLQGAHEREGKWFGQVGRAYRGQVAVIERLNGGVGLSMSSDGWDDLRLD